MNKVSLFISKIGAALLAVSFIISPATASAATTAELQAQLTLLVA